MLNKFFRFPWATAGDKTAIPDTTQVSGAVSYQQGYGPQYELAQSDPSSRDIERDKNNQLHGDITTALQEYQINGVPDWIVAAQNGGAAFPYAFLSRVRYSDGLVYVSAVAGNISTPGTNTDWYLDKGQLINIRLLTISGNYTPTPGAKSGLVMMVGGAAGSSGTNSASAGQVSIAGGAGGGAFVMHYFATLGPVNGYIIGAGGAGGPVGTPGGAGGQTNFGSLTAPGGGSSAPFAGLPPPIIVTGGAGGTTGTGGNLLNLKGIDGGPAQALSTTQYFGGLGGSSNFFGSGGTIRGNANLPGQPGSGYGAGPSGPCNGPSSSGQTGIAGQPGAILVHEYS